MSSSYTDYVTRDQVRDAVECPACGAAAERPCVRVRGRPRRSLHRERWDEYAWVEGEKLQRYLDDLALQAQPEGEASSSDCPNAPFLSMEFFVPDPKGGHLPPEEAEKIWDAARKGAEMDIGRKAHDRRVYRLDYVHDGNEISARVGGLDFYEKDLIMAIISFPGLYSIRCRIRGVVKIGEPIIVGPHDVRYVEDFD